MRYIFRTKQRCSFSKGGEDLGSAGPPNVLRLWKVMMAQFSE